MKPRAVLQVKHKQRMDESLKLEFFNRPDKREVERARKAERDNKKIIPEAFYDKLKLIDQFVKSRTMDMVKDSLPTFVKGAFGDYVRELYYILKKAGVDKEPAKNLIYGYLSKYRTVATIRDYLPKEALDERQSKNARSGNAKIKAKRENIKKAARKNILKGQEPMPFDKAGKLGGEKTGNKSLGGAYGGLGYKREDDPLVKEQERRYLADQIIKGEIETITVSLAADSEWSKKIRELWEGFGQAYIKVAFDGEIKKVYNVDRTPRQAALEKPIAN